MIDYVSQENTKSVSSKNNSKNILSFKENNYKTTRAIQSLNHLRGLLYEEITSSKDYSSNTAGVISTYNNFSLSNFNLSPYFPAQVYPQMYSGNYFNWFYYNMAAMQSVYANMYNMVLQNYIQSVQNLSKQQQAYAGNYPQYTNHISNVPDNHTSSNIPDQVTFTGRIVNPISGKYWVSSEFGVPRTGHTHKGIDLAANHGTPVKACADGTVEYIGFEEKGYGHWIEIRHPDGSSSRYAHLSQILVRSGQKVSSGTVIGKVGSSGRSSGPHLHFELRKSNGTAVNPRTKIAC